VGEWWFQSNSVRNNEQRAFSRPWAVRKVRKTRRNGTKVARSIKLM
jgi:hypothetical protein